MEESGRSCNNEDHDGYDEMTLMTMEWKGYVNRLVEESSHGKEVMDVMVSRDEAMKERMESPNRMISDSGGKFCWESH